MNTKQDIKDCMKRLCHARLTDSESAELIEKYGLLKKEATNQMLVAAKLLERAKKDGDVSAVKQICSILCDTGMQESADSLKVTLDFVSPSERESNENQ